jgi:hypothetical protein
MRVLTGFVFVLFVSGNAYSQVADSASSSEEVGLQVLQAVDYAKLQQIVINKQCRKIPGMAERVPACGKIGLVPRLAIDKMALPYFNSYVSEREARDALKFWTSPDGIEISKKFLKEIEDENPTLLTSEELNLLDSFNKSEAGRAMSRLAQDRSVSVTVIRAIGAYEP